MIEGAFVLAIGIGIGFAAAKVHYESKSIVNEKSIIDESKYLTNNKKYFTNRDFEEERGK